MHAFRFTWSSGLAIFTLLGVLTAAVLLDRALVKSGEDVNLTLSDAAAAAQIGDFTKCVATYTDVIEADSQSVTALVGRAQCEVSLRDGGEAVNDLNQAIRLSPRDPALVLTRAQAYSLLGNSSRAANDYVAVTRSTAASTDQEGTAIRGLVGLNLSNTAVATAQALLKAHPAQWQIVDAVAAAYAASGATGDAEHQYLAAYSLGDPAQKGITMAELAQMLRSAGSLNAALRDADQAVSLNPRWEHYRLRAEIREAAGDLSGADADFGHAITAVLSSWWPDQNTTVIWLLDERARLRLAEGHSPEAVSDLHLAIARAPDQETRRVLQSELAAIQTPA